MSIKSNRPGGADEPHGGHFSLFGQGGVQFPEQTAEAKGASNAENFQVNRRNERAGEPYEDTERRERYQEHSRRWAPERSTSEPRERFPADPGWQSRPGSQPVGHEDDFQKWEKE